MHVCLHSRFMHNLALCHLHVTLTKTLFMMFFFQYSIISYTLHDSSVRTCTRNQKNRPKTEPKQYLEFWF